VTPTPLPLADAAERLRGKPGRPRTALARAPRPPRAEVSGTSVPIADPPPERAAGAPVADVWLSWPRVLDIDGASRYLGVSTWTVRELRTAGHLPALEVPGVRRLLFDRVALDQAVDGWSARPASDGKPA
jgi:excisionase family DNA binding protein